MTIRSKGFNGKPPVKPGDIQKLVWTKEFYRWIVERHEIYRLRLAGDPYPWTEDPVLNWYKFTNPFRENDADTIWMRDYFRPDILNKKIGFADINHNIVNAALFRMIGTPAFAQEFLEQHRWITKINYNPELIKKIIKDRLAAKKKCFTGAYIVTNQGIKAPKADVVIDKFITPLAKTLQYPYTLPKTGAIFNRPVLDCMEDLHSLLKKFKGFGGGGFMAYEVVTDVANMPFYNPLTMRMHHPATYIRDRYSWANAGPGAIRGLNRIYDFPYKARMSQKDANLRMREIIGHKYLAHQLAKEKGYDPIEFKDIDMRCIEHSLCEFDKYCRVCYKQGKPRSVCKYREGESYLIKEGPVK